MKASIDIEINGLNGLAEVMMKTMDCKIIPAVNAQSITAMTAMTKIIANNFLDIAHSAEGIIAVIVKAFTVARVSIVVISFARIAPTPPNNVTNAIVHCV